MGFQWQLQSSIPSPSIAGSGQAISAISFTGFEANNTTNNFYSPSTRKYVPLCFPVRLLSNNTCSTSVRCTVLLNFPEAFIIGMYVNALCKQTLWFQLTWCLSIEILPVFAAETCGDVNASYAQTSPCTGLTIIQYSTPISGFWSLAFHFALAITL